MIEFQFLVPNGGDSTTIPVLRIIFRKTGISTLYNHVLMGFNTWEDPCR